MNYCQRVNHNVCIITGNTALILNISDTVKVTEEENYLDIETQLYFITCLTLHNYFRLPQFAEM